MIAATALALVVAASPATGPDPLAAARAALASGDPASAERLALAAAEARDAAALYLVGVARFRLGRPAEALDALDRAGPEGDAPGPWSYNRGACLLDLGRPEEAERAFVAAAEADRALAPVALVNAGFAALDAGALDRATAHAAAARHAAEGPGADLVGELERGVAEAAAARATAAYAAGLAAFDRGDFVEARGRFVAAAELAPKDGKSRLMAGASALRRGERDAGEADVRRALELGLAAEDARVALAYLQRPAAEGAWSALASAEAGWDSNALQTGTGVANDRFATAAGRTSSPFAQAELAIGWGGTLKGLRLDAGYDLVQLAYAAQAAQDYGVQQHAGLLALTFRPPGPLTLGLAAEGQVAFTGLSDFRGLLAAGGLRGWAALAEGRHLATRLELAADRRRGLDGFGYLGGRRLEAGLSQEVARSRATLRGGYRLRLDDLGDDVAAAPAPHGPQCDMMDGCTAATISRFGHLGQLGWLSAKVTLTPRLTLDLSAGIERRVYRGDDRFLVTVLGGPTLVAYAQRRKDWRVTAGASLGLQLAGPWSVVARWDHVTNLSTLDGRRTDCTEGFCPPSPLGDRNYEKDVVGVGISGTY
ncbi:MAG: hypothetical protein QM704_11240 [Anaeromyxobacteraceae bacterium]